MGVKCLRKMKIRIASKEDAGGIAKVHVDAWRFAYKDIMPADLLNSLSIPNKIKAWESILSGDAWPAYVAINNGGCVEGFIHLSSYRDDDFEEKNVGEVTALYINPELIGTGVGAQLFSQGLKHLQDLNYSKVALWVLEENKLGVKFYEKFGFLPDGGTKIHPKTGLVELRYVLQNFCT